MAISRRQFLASVALWPLNYSVAQAQNSEQPELLISACETAAGKHEVCALTTKGQTVWQAPLKARAHQVLVNFAKNLVVSVDRRPGTGLDIINSVSGQRLRRIESEPGFHLYGHAQFTYDDRFLVTTEQEFGSPHGCLVFRDSLDQFRVKRILDCGGVGPHEFKVIDSGRRIVVANGGIKTSGREKINLDSMQPSLVYLDTATGEILESRKIAEEFHQCSIRHLDIATDGTVLIAMQFEGERFRQAPLVALHKRGQDISPLPLPEQERAALNQYTGSACIDSSGDFAAISAPRGNRLLFWNIPNHKYLGAITVADGCGLARGTRAGEFFASSGRGRFYQIDSCSLKRQLISVETDKDLKWDNHLAIIDT